jgi:hypothetical protein
MLRRDGGGRRSARAQRRSRPFGLAEWGLAAREDVIDPADDLLDLVPAAKREGRQDRRHPHGWLLASGPVDATERAASAW